MMPVTPAGFAAASVELHHAVVPHVALVTLGIDVGLLGVSVASANLVQAAVSTNMRTVMDDDVTIGPTTLRGGTELAPTLAVSDPANNKTGVVNAQSPPPAVAVLCKKITGLGGRRNRGRWYWPWVVSNADVDEDGSIATAQLANLSGAFNAMHGDLVSGDVAPVVLHSASSPGPTTPVEITAFVVERFVASQRRRQER